MCLMKAMRLSNRAVYELCIGGEGLARGYLMAMTTTAWRLSIARLPVLGGCVVQNR